MLYPLAGEMGDVLFRSNFTQFSIQELVDAFNTRYLWPRSEIINNERQFYTDPENQYNPFSFSAENGLTITARKRNRIGEDYTTQEYLSGVISSARQSYWIIPPVDQWTGRISALLKLPLGIGVWPAWWFNPEIAGPWPQYPDGGPLAEIDGLEALGEAGVFYSTIHSRGTGGVLNQDQFKHVCPEQALNGFNWYHVERTRTHLRLGFNDMIYKEVPLAQDLTGALHMNLNLAVGGSWPETRGLPTEQSYQYHCKEIIAQAFAVEPAPLGMDDTLADEPPLISFQEGIAPGTLFDRLYNAALLDDSNPNKDVIRDLKPLRDSAVAACGEGVDRVFIERIRALS